jgi:hypothetical protein
MNSKKITIAMEEAQRFIALAKIAKKRFMDGDPYNFYVGPSREVASMKRASMDLTNALSALRRTSDET